MSPVETPTTGSVGTVETQFLDLPDPLRLDCGRELTGVRVAYETYGELSPERDNVILVCHALSGDAHAAGVSAAPPEESTRDGFAAEERDGTASKGLGWWDGMIGPGKAFDTDHYFVVSTNLLGGCRGTTGPGSTDPATGAPYGSDFPVVTVADMVRTERAFLDELGIDRLAAVAGGSLGGMQALEWAVLFPDQVDSIVVIASTHALQPQGVAWNAIAREAIRADPGPVVPRQPPSRLVLTTKKWSVSKALPGPIIPSHQPRPLLAVPSRSSAANPSRVLSSGGAADTPAAWASPLSAWQTRMTLSRSGDSSPYVS